MLRRAMIRKPLIAALALLMAAAPSVSPAGGIYGTKRTCPLQVKNYLGFNIDYVEVTHSYGVSNDYYKTGKLTPGAGTMAGTITYYTGGGLYAGDYWNVSVFYKNRDGQVRVYWRRLDHFDLTAIDQGVPLTIIISQEGDLYLGTGIVQKLNFYSNATSLTGLPFYQWFG